MAKVLVLYYSSWGHMEQMAKAAAEGAREAGADVTIKRVPNSFRRMSPRPRTTSWIRKRLSHRHWNSRTMTRSSSVSRHATARWPRS